MLEELRYVAVEGPIGAGKTRLARALAEHLSARLVLEPARENPFLEKFYADRSRYALATQIVFLVLRYRQQAELTRRYLFHPIAVSDYILARDRIFANLTLTEEELGLYNQLYEVFAPRAARPDVVVLLQADVDTLLERVRRRGRPYETAISRDYLARLVAAYDEYFRTYDESPLLVVDTNHLDYTKGGLDCEAVIREIEQTKSGRRFYVPEAEEEPHAGF